MLIIITATLCSNAVPTAICLQDDTVLRDTNRGIHTHTYTHTHTAVKDSQTHMKQTNDTYKFCTLSRHATTPEKIGLTAEIMVLKCRFV